MLLSLLLVSAALADEPRGCEAVSLADVVAVPPPAVIVLGERHGTQPDLARATRVVNRLARNAEVTVALEAVHWEMQRVLDDLAEGEVEPADLPEALEWQARWGFPFQPYARLLTAGTRGVDVVAAGLALGPKPDGQEIPVPAGYRAILRDAMAGHEMPPSQEDRFVESMAWRDHRIAETAVQNWDREGYLVVVTGRGHVEGGKGVPWQIEEMVDVPVHAFVLAWGEDPPCYTGDRLWKQGWLQRLF